MKKISVFICGPALIFLLLLLSCNTELENYYYKVPPNTGDGWETASVEEVGISLEPLTSLMNHYYNIEHKVHGILIVKNGKLVFEEYFPGYEFGLPSNNWKGPYCYFKWDTVHFLGSSTKSFVSALVGIAIDKEFIKNENVSMFSYFPDYSHLQDKQKNKITIEHLLSMTAGLEWVDGVTPETDLYKMHQSPDPIGYFLDRSVVNEPGTVWLYNSGSPTVAGEVIKRASGLDVFAFSGEYLFHKMEVSKFWWLYLQNNIVGCSGELFTTPRTMAKFGYLFLNKGIWKSTRIISEEWINKSVAPYIQLPQPHADPTPADSYGYSWWIYDYEVTGGDKVHSYSARGWGGQMIIVLPELDTVVVFTGGYYNPDRRPIQYIMDNYILPAIL